MVEGELSSAVSRTLHHQAGRKPIVVITLLLLDQVGRKTVVQSDNFSLFHRFGASLSLYTATSTKVVWVPSMGQSMYAYVRSVKAPTGVASTAGPLLSKRRPKPPLAGCVDGPHSPPPADVRLDAPLV
ncbi:hypothetical protein BHE74_00012547 [Ensete ventricosum]|nr:hypothetical protein GW17_00054767 [Ensete ventricosum]RWW79174.1 hypothetical protein BHE74_00012547 [Ensete ventricosum]